MPIVHLTNSINILDPCVCKNMIDSNGYGNCQGNKMENLSYGLSEVCYVTQPSGCHDLMSSTTISSEQMSAQACISEGQSQGITLPLLIL